MESKNKEGPIGLEVSRYSQRIGGPRVEMIHQRLQNEVRKMVACLLVEV